MTRLHHSPTTRPRVIVVVGGHRTGSTLQYNIIGTYLEFTEQGRRIGLVEPDEVDAVLQAESSFDGLLVAKCHHLAAGFGNFSDPTAWRRQVLNQVAVPISTTRPIADVQRSMCRKFGIEPGELLGSPLWKLDQANLRAWAELAPFTQRYEDLTEAPGTALRSLVDHLGLAWDAEAARSASTATGRSAAANAITSLDDGTWDPISLLHWNHIAPD